MRIAVVGSGIAGLSAAWALNRRHDVTVFEADDRIGGHANSVMLRLGGRDLSVDTGFVVYNERCYPRLTRLFRELDIATQASDMSFSVSLDDGEMEYRGQAGGLLAQPVNAFRPRFWRMLRDLDRFYRNARGLLDDGAGEGPSLGAYLEAEGYSDAFVLDHLLPMGAAIWSCSLGEMLNFPVRSFVQFCENHALLQYRGRPQWRTVTGGSRRYVERISESFRECIHLNRAVLACRRTPVGVFLSTAGGGEERFDEVVLACHSDQALRLLGEDASCSERAILGQLRYRDNLAVLHSDPALMPRRRAAWAAWNYLGNRDGQRDRKVSVTYWMNLLQDLDRGHPLFVSLNPHRRPRAETVHASFTYAHPQFDQAALAAQRRLPEIQGLRRTWFCGAYCGYGFHEDGLESGLRVAAELGAAPPWLDEVDSMSPAWQAAQPLLPLAAAE